MSGRAAGSRFWGLAAGRRGRSHNRRRARPQFISLEDRRLLSTFTVMDNSDDATDPQSLRYGILNEPAGTVINFAASVTGKILLYPEGPISITKNVDIEGPGAGVLTIDGGGGNGISRLPPV